jgi:hypothetical protein
MAQIYKSLYSVICILSTSILDLGYTASLDICQILMRYNYIHFGLTLFLSFWRKEAGIHIKDRCSTLLFVYQYSSA